MKAKEASRGKRRRKAVPVLGAAGLSLSLAGAAHAAIGGMAADMPARQGALGHEVTLCEEETSDISLATFHVFGKESSPRLRARIAAGGCIACATSESVNQPTGGGPAYAPRPRPVRPAQPYVRAIMAPAAPANSKMRTRGPSPTPIRRQTKVRAGRPNGDAGASTLNQSASQQGGAEVPVLGVSNTSN